MLVFVIKKSVQSKCNPREVGKVCQNPDRVNLFPAIVQKSRHSRLPPFITIFFHFVIVQNFSFHETTIAITLFHHLSFKRPAKGYRDVWRNFLSKLLFHFFWVKQTRSGARFRLRYFEMRRRQKIDSYPGLFAKSGARPVRS